MRKMKLLWVLLLAFALMGANAQVVTDFDVTYAAGMLEPGTPAPDFQLQDQNGKTLKFSEFAKGKYVVIDHGNGLQTLYGHCSELVVGVGEQVIQGQLIAKEGSTGIVTGPHLHFEVRSGSAKLNPINYLEHTY